MSGTMATKAGTQSLTLPQIVVGLLRHYLGGRRGLILLAVAILSIGAFLNWGWLVAAAEGAAAFRALDQGHSAAAKVELRPLRALPVRPERKCGHEADEE